MITDKASAGTSFAVQSIGHQNCHDAFAADLYEKLFLTEEQTVPGPLERGPPLVDISINGALADSAIIEGVLASMQVRVSLPVTDSCGHAICPWNMR